MHHLILLLLLIQLLIFNRKYHHQTPQILAIEIHTEQESSYEQGSSDKKESSEEEILECSAHFSNSKNIDISRIQMATNTEGELEHPTEPEEKIGTFTSTSRSKPKIG